MDYLSGLCSTVGSGINRVSTSIGGVVDTLIDGKYGIGTLHGKALAVGSYCYESRLAHIATQSMMAGGMVYRGALAIDNLEHKKTQRQVGHLPIRCYNGPNQRARYFVMPLILTLTTGTIYLANATNCGLQQLTAAATKEVLAKTALTLGDVYALYKTRDGNASKATRGLTGSYLAARCLDVLVNFGAASRGLVRCNPQPLLSNLNWVASWVR